MSLCVFNPPFLASIIISLKPYIILHLLVHNFNMDSFHEPRRVPEPIKLEDLTAQVFTRTAEYHAKGIPLSGRIIHVCHYLPITATLQQSSRPGILSPPATPPHLLANIPPISSPGPTAALPGHAPGENSSRPRWSLSGRQGHGAMISGIRSLSATHEQFIIGWTGDIESPNTNSGMLREHALHLTRLLSRMSSAGEKIKIPSTTLSEEDRTALEEEIANFKSEDEDTKTTTTYVPLLLDDKVAHAHYDGYCKQSEILIVINYQLHLFSSRFLQPFGRSSTISSGRMFRPPRSPQVSRRMSIGLLTSRLIPHLPAE
jgi:trehalose 6-phosphate synthase/phosphatase